MNKFVSLLAAAGLAVSASFGALAADTAKLKDGTTIEIDGDAVSVVGADGAKTPAPDGTHTLEDGTTVTTKDGKKVAM